MTCIVPIISTLRLIPVLLARYMWAYFYFVIHHCFHTRAQVVYNFNACLSDAASGNYVTRDGDTASDLNLMAVMRRTFHSFGEEVKALAQGKRNIPQNDREIG